MCYQPGYGPTVFVVFAGACGSVIPSRTKAYNCGAAPFELSECARFEGETSDITPATHLVLEYVQLGQKIRRNLETWLTHIDSPIGIWARLSKLLELNYQNLGTSRSTVTLVAGILSKSNIYPNRDNMSSHSRDQWRPLVILDTQLLQRNLRLFGSRICTLPLGHQYGKEPDLGKHLPVSKWTGLATRLNSAPPEWLLKADFYKTQFFISQTLRGPSVDYRDFPAPLTWQVYEATDFLLASDKGSGDAEVKQFLGGEHHQDTTL
ncbi:hypothetical protein C8J56DRAFT_893138 [Mycena floridula]|nr:hypothetical protein C8J56DRAFT_893138 [Mycena floridula]